MSSAKNDKRPSEENGAPPSKKGRCEDERASQDSIPEPIIPRHVATPSHVRWIVEKDCLLIRQDTRISSKQNKAAAFDLSGTLLVSRIAGQPSQPEDYELWSSTVIRKLQELSDDGYQLILFVNEGRIRTAYAGKVAARTKGLVDWIAAQVERPLHAVVSTSTKSGLHKPNPDMWKIGEKYCNSLEPFDLELSFFVGDRDGSDEELEDPIKRAEDKLFAERVSSSREGATLQFYTPWKFFGESDKYRRKATQEAQLPAYDAPPPVALQTRAALLGGYLQGPILLILCGAQGCGKSTFCKRVTQDEDSHWVHLSQDTIRDGKPGKRDAVQEAALGALRNHQSVVIDRMHLDPEQRLHFIQVAQRANVPVHAVVLHASRSELIQRVRDRTDHPAGVQGDAFVKLAVRSLETIVTPTYEEGLALISISGSTDAANNLADLYRRTTVFPDSMRANPLPSLFCLYNKKDEPFSVLPSIAMGSYKLGKLFAASVLTFAATNGINAVDTAPTYDNEESIGDAIDTDTFLIVKVPKRATQPSQVRTEVLNSLRKLKRNTADLALLHWPCDFIRVGTLEAVWKELEYMKSEGHYRNLGVSNFSVGALRTLLPFCKVERPVVNQVERHPLLPQWELLDFCTNNGILLQAYTPRTR